MTAPETVALRPPGEVMRLARMGCFHPTRLSFVRVLMRRMAAEGWRAERTLWDIDAHGIGRAVYTMHGPARRYALVCFAHDLPDHMRTDRVIAEAWDSTFALVDGAPDAGDLDRLAANVPLQEAGRLSEREIVLLRANRSVRLFQSIVASLAAGKQPDAAEIARVGYLMRTTAVYGSGKFGMADRAVIADRPELAPPYQAEMLAVWLCRAFTVDLVEHLARERGGAAAVRLAPELRHMLGVGNATGLGMAPYLVNHPVLINNWFRARETALARVRAAEATAESRAAFAATLPVVRAHVDGWRSEHPIQVAKLADLRRDLATLAAHLATGALDGARAWDRLWTWGQAALSPEGQEMLVSLMLEPHGHLVDDLAAGLAADEAAAFAIDGRQSVGALRDALARDYDWALARDWQAPEETARIWYSSIEKLEPRLAERADEPLEPWEQPLAPGRDAAALATALADWPRDAPVAGFLVAHPELRHMVRRAQIVAANPYAELRDNTIAAEMLPIDMLRAKLSFFGATRYDPRSDRWVRVTFFQGAPYPDEPEAWAADNWVWTP